MKKKNILILLGTVCVLIAVIVCGICKNNSREGGRVYISDVKPEYTVYVVDEYLDRYEGYLDYSAEPHDVFKVTDAETKEMIMSYCGELRQYREFDNAADVMLGGGEDDVYHLPKIYIIGNKIGYIVSFYYWDNYSSDAWSDFTIKKEFDGTPTAHIYRIDVSEIQEETERFTYLSEYSGPDTLNSDGRNGWISTMGEDDYSALMDILYSMGKTNSEVYTTIS